MKKKLLFIIMSILIITTNSFGENLERLKKIAINNNPSLQRKKLDIIEARNTIIGAIAQITPDIKAQIGGAYLYDPILEYNMPNEDIPIHTSADVDMPGIGVVTVPIDTTINLSDQQMKIDLGQLQLQTKLIIEQPIFTGGRIVNGVLMSIKNRNVKLEEFLQQKTELIYKVEKAYYKYLLSKKYLHLTVNYLALSKEYLNAAQKSYDAGVLTELSLLDAKSKIKNLTAENIKAKNNLQTALEYIQYICNDSSIKSIEGELVQIDENIDEKKDVNLALLTRHDLKALKVQQQISKIDFASGIGTMPIIPEIGMQVEFSYSNTNKDNNWDNVLTNIQIGIVGKIKIYDKMKTTVALLNKINNMKKIKLGLEEMTKGIKLEIKKAIRDYENNYELAKYWQGEVDNLKKELKEADIKLKNGVITKTDYLAKKIELQETQLSYYKVITDLLISRSNYIKTLGSYSLDID